jgi:hypothetical protein
MSGDHKKKIEEANAHSFMHFFFVYFVAKISFYYPSKKSKAKILTSLAGWISILPDGPAHFIKKWADYEEA